MSANLREPTVVDAVLWAFGARAQKLRAKKSLDLVNDVVARDCCEASHPKGAPICSVSLAFKTCASDESTGTVQFTRSISLLGNAKSKFTESRFTTNLSMTRASIDKSVESLRQLNQTQLNDFFQRYNLDPTLSERFIIVQSNVTRLAQSASGVALLGLLERVCGTHKLKVLIEEKTQQIFEETEAHEKLNELLHELEMKRKPLIPAVELFERYQGDLSIFRKQRYQVLTIKRDVCVMILEDLSRDRDDILDQIQASTQDLQNVVIKLTAAQDKRQSLESTFHELETSYNEMTSNIGALRRKLIKKKVQSKNAQEKLCAEKQSHIQMKKKIVNIKKKITSNKSQLSKSSKERAKLQARIDDAHKMESVSVESVDLDTEKFELELDRLQTQRQRLESSVSTLRMQKKEANCLKKKIDDDMEQSIDLQQQCKDLKQQEIQLKLNVKATDEQLCEQITNLKECKDCMQSTSSKIQDLDTEIGAALRKSSQNKIADIIEKMKREQFASKIGVIYGMLCDVATVKKEFQVAACSVLRGSLRKIVVSTRAVAIKISEYFKEHNIGRMQCIIVDEIKAPSYRDKSSLTKKLTPLINGIQTSESLLPMFKAFTASWHLATTKNIALVTMKKQRQQSRHYQYNIVTAAGERFFGSGEIRSALAPRVFMRSLRESILKVACEKSRKTRVSQPAVTRSSLKALEHEKKTHEEQLKQQRQNVKKLIIAVEERRKNKKALLQKQRMLQNKLQAVKQSQSGISKRVERQQCELESLRTLMSSEGDIAARREEVKQIAARQKEIEKQIKKRKPKQLRKKKSMQEQLKKLSRSISRLTARTDKILPNQQKELEKTVDRVAKAIAKIEKTEKERCETIKEMTSSMEELAAKQVDVRNHFVNAKDVLEVAKGEANSLKKTHEKITKSIETLEHAKASILVNIKNERKAKKTVSKALKNATKAGGETFAEDHSGSAWEEIEDGKNVASGRAWVISKERELEKEKIVLDQLGDQVEVEKLQLVLKIDEEVESTRQRQSALAATIKQMETERNRMSQERVSKLLTFLETVNDHASRLFQELCPYGDCSLVYSGDNALLFEEGVSLRCKPDRTSWKSFAQLSGGQKTQCSLSLSLAFQAVVPCPFYIMDEVDAALDSVKCQKVAELLRSLALKGVSSCSRGPLRAQYIIISHRREVYERCGQIIGIYRTPSPHRFSRVADKMLHT